MTWWPIYLACGLVMLWAASKPNKYAVALMVWGLFLMQVWDLFPLGGDKYLVYFVTWLVISGSIWRQRPTQFSTPIFAASILTLNSAMCYVPLIFIGEGVNQPIPMRLAFWADMFGIAALLWVSKDGIRDRAKDYRRNYHHRIGHRTDLPRRRFGSGLFSRARNAQTLKHPRG